VVHVSDHSLGNCIPLTMIDRVSAAIKQMNPSLDIRARGRNRHIVGLEHLPSTSSDRHLRSSDRTISVGSRLDDRDDITHLTGTTRPHFAIDSRRKHILPTLRNERAWDCPARSIAKGSTASARTGPSKQRPPIRASACPSSVIHERRCSRWRTRRRKHFLLLSTTFWN